MSMWLHERINVSINALSTLTSRWQTNWFLCWAFTCTKQSINLFTPCQCCLCVADHRKNVRRDDRATKRTSYRDDTRQWSKKPRKQSDRRLIEQATEQCISVCDSCQSSANLVHRLPLCARKQGIRSLGICIIHSLSVILSGIITNLGGKTGFGSGGVVRYMFFRLNFDFQKISQNNSPFSVFRCCAADSFI